MTKIKGNLDIHLNEDPDVFIAGGLLWYPIEGDNKIRQAPNVMVAFGRPREDRGSYRQWEEQNIPPQIIFEMIGPSHTQEELLEKHIFYETYGVEEFYIYDPYTFHFSGWIRQQGKLSLVTNVEDWVSPRLNIRFTQVNGALEIYRPNGRRFLTFAERYQQYQKNLAETDRLLAQLRELGSDPETS